jgi:hypothetical protein
LWYVVVSVEWGWMEEAAELDEGEEALVQLAVVLGDESPHTLLKTQYCAKMSSGVIPPKTVSTPS